MDHPAKTVLQVVEARRVGASRDTGSELDAPEIAQNASDRHCSSINPDLPRCTIAYATSTDRTMKLGLEWTAATRFASNATQKITKSRMPSSIYLSLSGHSGISSAATGIGLVTHLECCDTEFELSLSQHSMSVAVGSSNTLASCSSGFRSVQPS